MMADRGNLPLNVGAEPTGVLLQERQGRKEVQNTLIFFLCSLFKDAVGSSHYIA
jgi:hypothetical protein